MQRLFHNEDFSNSFTRQKFSLSVILKRLENRERLLFEQLVKTIPMNKHSSIILATEIQQIRTLRKKLQMLNELISNIHLKQFSKKTQWVI